MSIFDVVERSVKCVEKVKPQRKGTVIQSVYAWFKENTLPEIEDFNMHPSQLERMCPREEVFKVFTTS